MKKLQEGFVPFLVLIIVTIFIAGGGIYYYSQRTNTHDSVEAFSNISTCNVIDTSDLFIQQRQKAICIRKIAVENDDLGLCGRIKDEEVIGSCYASFAIKRKDISLCEKISSKSAIKGQCRSSVAIARQDLTLCDTLPNERGNFGKDACYAAIGGEKHDYAICDRIPEDNFKDYRYRCIEDIARRKGECDVITKQVGKDYCYLYQSESIQVTVKDNRCDIYKEPKLADLCVKHLRGEVTLNAMCGKISDNALKQQCLTYNIDAVHVNYDNNGQP